VTPFQSASPSSGAGSATWPRKRAADASGHGRLHGGGARDVDLHIPAVCTSRQPWPPRECAALPGSQRERPGDRFWLRRAGVAKPGRSRIARGCGGDHGRPQHNHHRRRQRRCRWRSGCASPFDGKPSPGTSTGQPRGRRAGVGRRSTSALHEAGPGTQGRQCADTRNRRAGELSPASTDRTPLVLPLRVWRGAQLGHSPAEMLRDKTAN
jgi:hypothetical protein